MCLYKILYKHNIQYSEDYFKYYFKKLSKFKGLKSCFNGCQDCAYKKQ